ncbi:MAG: alanine racemase [Acidimicrobiales bacterium]
MSDSPRYRDDIATPALVCDLDALDANVALMAVTCRGAGVALRPHAKSHKSAFVARRQLAAGASGLACAKLAEAEALVDALGDEALHVSILLTSPLVGARAAARAALLAERCRLTIAVDSPVGVTEIASARARVDVVCDVDVGLGRTGVIGAAGALAVAAATSAAGLGLTGVQAYGGHLQHLAGRDARRAATAESASRLAEVVDALERAGFECALRTGGGTGTAGIDVELGWLSELQPGSYVFMDREYRDALGDDPEGRYAQSLFVDATVVSANHDGYVTVDAGFKALATDAGVPAVVRDAGEASYAFYGDEHGMVTYDRGHPLHRGDRVTLVPPHCDPTVDRYDRMWLVRGNDVIGAVPIDARGRAQ